MSTSEALFLAKKTVRRGMKEILRSISSREIQKQSNVVCEKLFKMPEFENSQRISVFLSMENEIQTVAILDRIFSTGRTCFVPQYHREIMEMVRLYSMNDFNELPETKWKIKQPGLGDNRENAMENGGLDLVICPGVAFTERLERLGHGAGYYDKYLRKLITEMHKWNRRPHIIALAFKEQILKSLPTSEYDVKMDKVLFDDSN